jgi:hypothetical protein
MPRPRKRQQPESQPESYVVFSIDYRGNDDDVLTFVFMGAHWDTITRVFKFLCCPNGIARGFSQYEEHACIMRNGKGYRRICVELPEPNYHFASLSDMCLLVEARLHAEQYPCRVKLYRDYEKFINI